MEFVGIEYTRESNFNSIAIRGGWGSSSFNYDYIDLLDDSGGLLDI